MSPVDQVYISTPNSPDVPLTPPDENDSKPKVFANLSDYNLQVRLLLLFESILIARFLI